MKKLEFGFKTVAEEQYEKKKGRIVTARFSNRDPRLLAVTFSNSFVIMRIDEDKTNQRVAKSSKVR